VEDDDGQPAMAGFKMCIKVGMRGPALVLLCMAKIKRCQLRNFVLGG
jgi:hypothetical protein